MCNLFVDLITAILTYVPMVIIIGFPCIAVIVTEFFLACHGIGVTAYASVSSISVLGTSGISYLR